MIKTVSKGTKFETVQSGRQIRVLASYDNKSDNTQSPRNRYVAVVTIKNNRRVPGTERVLYQDSIRRKYTHI